MTRLRHPGLFVLLALIVLAGAWLYWNRPRRTDMAAYVPSDCLAFIEVDNAVTLVDGVEQSEAWKALAPPIGARSLRSSGRWLVGLARWTGIGSADAVLLARSQFAIVFSGAEANQTESSLTIKPLAVLVIETHTSERRMKPALEAHLQEFAERMIDHPALTRKQVNGADLSEWSSPDGAHRLVAAFADTVAIVGNDEASVLRCVDVHGGRTSSLAGDQKLAAARAQAQPQQAPVFGFVPKAGVKPLLQAWILNRAGSAENGATIARLFSDVFGNIIDGLSWTSTFIDGVNEDRCFVSLSGGIANQLRPNAVPDDRTIMNDPGLVPRDAYSISAYHFRDTEGVWRDLNAIVSSHADVVGAIASRPLLRSLLEPYGIHDPDLFVRAAGTHLETIRREENSTSVLVTDAFDRPTLVKAAQPGLQGAAKHETVGTADLILSTSDNWAASFVDNRFLIGRADDIRACLAAKDESRTPASDDAFKRARQLVDFSLPLIAVTFTEDRKPAISFVELFSEHERSAFSTNAEGINQASRKLPYAVSVTMLKENGVEWTSRSSFGFLGALILKFTPENMH